MNKQEVWDYDFLRIAGIMAEHSTCCRKQVGAVIVKNGRVISTGYNGTPAGMINCKDHFKPEDIKKPTFFDIHGKFSANFEVHAEQNAIAELSKNEVNGVGSTLYTTLAPCSMCAKLIAAAGIKRVVYAEEYDRDMSGPELLKQCGLDVIYFPWKNKDDTAKKD